MFGGLGKAVSGGFGKMGKAMKGGSGIDAGPSGGFMSRFKQNLPGALNMAAQQYGGPMRGPAMIAGRMFQPTQGNAGMQKPAAPMPPPQMEGVNTAPSPNFMPNMGGSFPGMGMGMGIWNPWARGPMELQDMSTGQSRTIPPPSGDSIFSRLYNRGQIYT